MDIMSFKPTFSLITLTITITLTLTLTPTRKMTNNQLFKSRHPHPKVMIKDSKSYTRSSRGILTIHDQFNS